MDVINFLYSTVIVASAIAYLPQALKIARRETACHDISLPAWCIWAYTHCVGLLYSVYILADMKLSAVNAINVFFVTLIIVITLYKRRKYRADDDVKESLSL